MLLNFILIPPVLFIFIHLLSGSKKIGFYLQMIYGLMLVAVSAPVVFSTMSYSLSFSAIQVFHSFRIVPAYYLDGKNAPLILMIGMIIPLIFFIMKNHLSDKGSLFYIPFNVFVLGLAGAFVSDSLIIFYFFYELSLIGAYFLIGLFGTGEKSGALTRFFLFTLTGSLAMLFSIAGISAITGSDVPLSHLSSSLQAIPPSLRLIIFSGFFLAFAVKMPLFLFHGWMRQTYAGSSPPVRAILSAAMSKLGAYGFLIILAGSFAKEMQMLSLPLFILAAAGALYGALLCLGADDIFDVIVYSSLVHLSVIALGIFSGVSGNKNDLSALGGSLFQMFNHGLIMAMLFALEDKIGPRLAVTGLRGKKGRLYAVFLIAIFSSISLPGMSNFAGELIVLYSSFKVNPYITLIAGAGLLIAAAALVRSFHKLFLGKPSGGKEGDLTIPETGLTLVMTAFWILLGIFPDVFLRSALTALQSLRGGS